LSSRPFLLTLDDPYRPHPGPSHRHPRPIRHRDDLIDVLIRLGLLLRQTLVAPGAGEDAAGLQLLVDPPAGRGLARRRWAQGRAGKATGAGILSCMVQVAGERASPRARMKKAIRFAVPPLPWPARTGRLRLAFRARG